MRFVPFNVIFKLHGSMAGKCKKNNGVKEKKTPIPKTEENHFHDWSGLNAN